MSKNRHPLKASPAARVQQCVLMLCLCTAWLFASDVAAAGDSTADMLVATITNEKADRAARIDAMEVLFEKHFKPHGTLGETAAFFKRCRWITREDWKVVAAFAGQWPFEEDDLFSATPFRTKLVALKMRPLGYGVANVLWLAFPQDAKITEQEIEMIFSGKCPKRLAKSHLLDGHFRQYFVMID